MHKTRESIDKQQAALMKESTNCCKCKKEITGVSFIVTNCTTGKVKTYCSECYKISKK